VSSLRLGAPGVGPGGTFGDVPFVRQAAVARCSELTGPLILTL